MRRHRPPPHKRSLSSPANKHRSERQPTELSSWVRTIEIANQSSVHRLLTNKFKFRKIAELAQVREIEAAELSNELGLNQGDKMRFRQAMERLRLDHTKRLHQRMTRSRSQAVIIVTESEQSHLKVLQDYDRRIQMKMDRLTESLDQIVADEAKEKQRVLDFADECITTIQSWRDGTLAVLTANANQSKERLKKHLEELSSLRLVVEQTRKRSREVLHNNQSYDREQIIADLTINVQRMSESVLEEAFPTQLKFDIKYNAIELRVPTKNEVSLAQLRQVVEPFSEPPYPPQPKPSPPKPKQTTEVHRGESPPAPSPSIQEGKRRKSLDRPKPREHELCTIGCSYFNWGSQVYGAYSTLKTNAKSIVLTGLKLFFRHEQRTELHVFTMEGPCDRIRCKSATDWVLVAQELYEFVPRAFESRRLRVNRAEREQKIVRLRFTVPVTIPAHKSLSLYLHSSDGMANIAINPTDPVTRNGDLEISPFGVCRKRTKWAQCDTFHVHRKLFAGAFVYEYL